MQTRLRVGILLGGRSTEHEVSWLSARNVVAALDPAKHEPVLIAIDKSGRWRKAMPRELEAGLGVRQLDERSEPVEALAIQHASVSGDLVFGNASAVQIEALDVVFPVLHGTYGEDGTVQGLLELLDLPYVGAGVLGAAVGMDKDVAKRLLRDSGIGVADFVTVRKHEFERDPDLIVRRAAELGFPLFTKPANAGSSVGVRRVASAEQLPAALAHAFAFDMKVLIEEAVDGREIECAVLGNEEPMASVPGEVLVCHDDGFYSYEAKYLDEKGAVLQMPAELSDAERCEVQSLAVRAFQALECCGMARVDFFLRPSGQWLVNEINTIPGFTAISMYPKLWELTGIARTELVSRLIELALERKAKQRALATEWRIETDG